ncbi:Glycerol-3-phosphate dehydrogenase [Acetobacteraceae bacterium EV16G]|uniref:Glycerol-3-phosphate dehydrogenase n=1 Tax=Sorlinia euscelidii TaxID=3081148 RepID=A0ABU7U4A2_9PROT
MKEPSNMPLNYDLLIIGGGINGTGIARDAAGRGARVLLVEKDDLAGHTSSASTKLIHGGLRYLEYYEFRLVREALMERENLLRIAPHIIWPMRFILPHSTMLRPAWLLRAGLFIYDHLCMGMTLPKTRRINFRKDPTGGILQRQYVKGFEYSDGWVQDSRLVVLNAMSAREHGATIRTRSRLLAAERFDDYWEARIEDSATGAVTKVTARAIVNAAGPWVTDLLHGELSVSSRNSTRLVKGSHIVVPKLFDTPQAYILQNPDKRIVFAVPYERDFTLIGTTDVNWDKSADHVAIDDAEVTYLCESVNRYFNKSVSPKDVVWQYAGVRALFDDHAGSASAVTRDYKLDLDVEKAPVISIFGGKITTYRKLAEHVIEKLAPHLPVLSAESWTSHAVLPGGDFARAEFDRQVAALIKKAPYLTPETAWRLVRNYGTRARNFVTSRKEALGQHFGADLFQAEVDYLISEEWARSVDDIIWRRGKFGLRLKQDEVSQLAAYIDGKLAANA